jgi:hypothetical protein
MGEHRPLHLRGGLRRLSTGAIAYGVIGLVVAILGLVALAWVHGRVDTLAGRVGSTVDELATTVDRTAVVLHDASTTAQSFGVTLTSSADAVAATGGSLAEVSSDLHDLEAQLGSFSVLGATPLTSAANAVGRIAASLDGIEVRLTTIGQSLSGNTDALAANAASLGALGDSMQTLAARLRSGSIESSLDDLQTVLVVVFVVFAGWTAVPAVGALAFGMWLRRTLDEPVA